MEAATDEPSARSMNLPTPPPAQRESITLIETPTGATRVLHFRDRRSPHQIQCVLERNLMTLFSTAVENGRLVFRAQPRVVGAVYQVELGFAAALPLKNCYWLRSETSWAGQPADNHDYYRKTSGSWFDFWTRDFIAAPPPEADAGSASRYRKRCDEALNAEKHLDSIPAVQQTILAELKKGASFATSHKEGGTNIRWTNGHFVRSDYGEYPGGKTYSDEGEFLEALRRFFNSETSSNSYPEKPPEFHVWKLILRLLRPA